MTKYNLSDEEQEKILLERMACEAQKPETEEEKRLAEKNIREAEEFFNSRRKRK